jgi:hypothetical protein
VKNVLKDGWAEIARVKTENDAFLKELEKLGYDVSLFKETCAYRPKKRRGYGSIRVTGTSRTGGKKDV